MKKRFCINVLVLCSLLVITRESFSQSISITGGWSPSISSADIPDAGNDFTNPFNSTGTLIQMAVNVQPDNRRYEVYVSRSDIFWNAAFTLRVRRSSNGTNPSAPPAGQISGGTNFITITAGNTQFFTGRRDRVNVDIEYRLLGVSVTLPAAIYSTTVVYTLVQL